MPFQDQTGEIFQIKMAVLDCMEQSYGKETVESWFVPKIHYGKTV